MRRGSWRAQSIALALAAFTTVLAASSASEAAAHADLAGTRSLVTQPRLIDEVGTGEVGIPLCAGPSDLDCLESVAIIRGGQRITPRGIGHADEAGASDWSYPGPGGETVQLMVDARLMPVGVKQSWGGEIPAARVQVQRSSDTEHPMLTWDDIDCTTGRIEDCTVWGPALPTGDVVEISLRMSWLKPLNVTAQGQDLAYRQEAVQGGNRYVLKAQEHLGAAVRVTEGPLESWRVEAWEPKLFFIIDHAGKDASESAYDPRCASAGAPVTSHNALGAGQPFWVRHEGSLNFGIAAPHLGPDGAIYRGHFEASFPIAWLRCQAGDKRLRLNGFVVQVLDERGVEQVATTTLVQRRGIVRVRALNFHYSAPTVRLIHRSKA